MSTAVQLRRGSTAEHATFTGLQAEATVDTTKNTLVIHNGSTVGGTPLLKENLSNANPANLASLNAVDTDSDDTFLIYDQSALAQKKITKAELFTNLAYTGTLTGGTGVINIGSGQLYKDASGNVGFGTTSPSNRLTVAGSGGLAYMRVEATDATLSGKFQARPSTSAVEIGAVSNSPLILVTNDTERMRITSAGTLILNQGQIQFPATQVASTNANTLDDYEEGTWTPVMRVQNSETGITYALQVGRYTKIGNIVTLFGQINLTNKGAGTGEVSITGVPFPAVLSGSSPNQWWSSHRAVFLFDANVSSIPAFVGGFVGAPFGVSGLTPRVQNSTGTTIINNTQLTNTSSFTFSCTYAVSV